MLLLVVRGVVWAQGQAPAPAESSRPLLEQLNSEAQSLYQEVQRGVAQVQLPPPKWVRAAAEAENPANTWKNLNPAVKAKLEDEQKTPGGQRRLDVTVDAATRPGQSAEAARQTQAAGRETPVPERGAATAPAGWKMTRLPDGTVRLEPQKGAGSQVLEIRTGGEAGQDGAIATVGPMRLTTRPGTEFAPNNIGLLLDPAGHVLIPMFIEKAAAGEHGVALSVGGGEVQRGAFVGSDRQTNLTILKVDQPAGHPVRLSDNRPGEGSMVMILAPNSGVGRLALWTGGQQDYGVVVAMDGSVYGFARYGQFLSAAVCKPVIRQLIETGEVKRAKLGVVVGEVKRQDPARVQIEALGSRPALRVMEVSVDSAASKGGLKEGDLILSVNGQAMGDTPTFGAVIAACRGKTELIVLRDGKPVNVTVDMKSE